MRLVKFGVFALVASETHGSAREEGRQNPDTKDLSVEEIRKEAARLAEEDVKIMEEQFSKAQLKAREEAHLKAVHQAQVHNMAAAGAKHSQAWLKNAQNSLKISLRNICVGFCFFSGNFWTSQF